MYNIVQYSVFTDDFNEQTVRAQLRCIHQMTHCHLAGRCRRCTHD
jgi:hypothetical protein